MRDTTPNQKWVGKEAKRIKKRDGRGGMAAEGCQCVASMCGGRELAAWCIVDNFTLLGHDVECHDPETARTASKIADEPDLIYFNNTIEPRIKTKSIINGIFLYHLQEGGVVPSGQHRCSWQMSFGGNFSQPVPIAAHLAIEQIVPYQWMHSDWLGLAKKAAKTDSSGKFFVPWWEQQRMICGCVVAIIQYTRCRVHRTDNTQTQ